MALDLKAMLLGRCPRCRRGSIFKPGLLGAVGAMNESCLVCRLPFLREAGYFLGAMYVSYGLGVATVLPVALVLAAVLKWPLYVVLPLMVAQTLISIPLFLRFSRLLWLHVDQAIDPR
jgi:uncharacterized protein (DUF983 family)